MPTPGQIATDMQHALRDLEAALQRLSAALGLAPYEAPAIRHPDRAYVDMVRTRTLADWLAAAVAALEDFLPVMQDVADKTDQALEDGVAHLLAPLTKAQLLELAAYLGLTGVSDSQRKDDLIAALVAYTLSPDDEPTDAEES